MALANENPFGDSPIPPIVLLIIYFCATMLSIANYVAYIRYNEDVYGGSLLRAYLAFTVLGTTTYAIFSGVMWTWAAKYVSTAEQRIAKISYGMFGIFLMHDLPIYIMEYHGILCCGWRNPFFGFVFVIHYITFIISFVFTWLTYAWRMAALMESMWGTGPVLKTGREQIAVLPASVAASIAPPSSAPGSGFRMASSGRRSSSAAASGIGPAPHFHHLQQPILEGPDDDNDANNIGASPPPAMVRPMQMQPMAHARGATSGARMGSFDSNGNMVWSNPSSPVSVSNHQVAFDAQQNGGGGGRQARMGGEFFVGPASGERSRPREQTPMTFQWSPRSDVANDGSSLDIYRRGQQLQLQQPQLQQQQQQRKQSPPGGFMIERHVF